jgi:hypothetical protein
MKSCNKEILSSTRFSCSKWGVDTFPSAVNDTNRIKLQLPTYRLGSQFELKIIINKTSIVQNS